MPWNNTEGCQLLFWKKLKFEFVKPLTLVNHLKNYGIWFNDNEKIHPGAFVLMRQDNFSSLLLKLGNVETIHSVDGGMIRAVTVDTKS